MGVALGRAVDRRRGAEDEAAGAGGRGRLEDGRRPVHVDAEVAVRLGHGLGDLGERRHVHDGLAAAFDERGAHGVGVADVAAHQGHARGDCRRVSAREVVVDDHVMAARREARDDDAADVAGSAGDEDAHAAMLSAGDERRAGRLSGRPALAFTSP